jgi:hypothetical protein
LSQVPLSRYQNLSASASHAKPMLSPSDKTGYTPDTV